MHQFKVGMRVRAIKDHDGKILTGKTGTVLHVGSYIGVEFDEFIDGHNSHGGKEGHVWNVDADCLAPAKGKPGRPPKVQYILQYMRTSDPFETFFSLEDAKKRIAELVDTDRYVKRDSFVLYHVDKIHKVDVSTAVTVSKATK